MKRSCDQCVGPDDFGVRCMGGFLYSECGHPNCDDEQCSSYGKCDCVCHKGEAS
jgi:hypothetical protein